MFKISLSSFISSLFLKPCSIYLIYVVTNKIKLNKNKIQIKQADNNLIKACYKIVQASAIMCSIVFFIFV